MFEKSLKKIKLIIHYLNHLSELFFLLVLVYSFYFTSLFIIDMKTGFSSDIFIIFFFFKEFF